MDSGRDPRLPPPGNWIERKYKGRTIRVLVISDGFEFEGERYRSLSAIAKAVTGSHINGFLFFRLWGDKAIGRIFVRGFPGMGFATPDAPLVTDDAFCENGGNLFETFVRGQIGDRRFRHCDRLLVE